MSYNYLSSRYCSPADQFLSTVRNAFGKHFLCNQLSNSGGNLHKVLETPHLWGKKLNQSQILPCLILYQIESSVLAREIQKVMLSLFQHHHRFLRIQNPYAIGAEEPENK